MIHPMLAAALLLAQAAPAVPAAPNCITHEEAGDIAVSLLPFLVDAAAQRCRPHLASGAFLLTGAGDWSARLRREAAPRRASALSGMSKFAGAMAPAGAGGEAAFDFVAQLITAGLTGNIRTENCGQLDTIAQSLQPLPTDNIARLVGATLAFAMTADPNGNDDGTDDDDNDDDEDGRGESGSGEPPICRS
jgi:hypothetical protein